MAGAEVTGTATSSGMRSPGIGIVDIVEAFGAGIAGLGLATGGVVVVIVVIDTAEGGAGLPARSTRRCEIAANLSATTLGAGYSRPSPAVNGARVHCNVEYDEEMSVSEKRLNL